MGIINKTLIVKWHGRNKTWYESKGYIFTNMGDKFEVKIKDLPISAKVKIEIKCDNCFNLLTTAWKDYNRLKKENNMYYCKKCAINLYGKKIAHKNRLENGNSFEQWCINNNRQDILDRWDYELNGGTKPSEITYGLNKKFWFKCLKGIHKSELKNINSISSGYLGSIDCKACNSFAQWGINTFGDDFLEKYWDYDKNEKLKIDPWEISYCSNKKVYILCQEKDYHGGYDVSCNSFYNGSRCPYCGNKGGKVHYLDSLGQYIVNKYGESFLNKIWSSKNDKSAFEYSPNSHQKVWIKCINGKHKDCKRIIKNANLCDFRCPECQHSEGESKISNIFITNNIDYIPQKEFNGLTGLNGGNLSFDFYLPQTSTAIEYDGEFHYKPIKNHKNEPIEYAKKRLKKQQHHDQLKNEYCKKHNIKLIRIPYWDFDNIEQILIEDNIIVSKNEYIV